MSFYVDTYGMKAYWRTSNVKCNGTYILITDYEEIQKETSAGTYTENNKIYTRFNSLFVKSKMCVVVCISCVKALFQIC